MKVFAFVCPSPELHASLRASEDDVPPQVEGSKGCPTCGLIGLTLIGEVQLVGAER